MMTPRQRQALATIAAANRRGQLPTTYSLRDAGVHWRTLATLRRDGLVELHLPAVGVDGFRLTAAGTKRQRRGARRGLT